MGLGVLDVADGQHVPGTIIAIAEQPNQSLHGFAGTSFIHDDASRPFHAVDVHSGLKYDRSGSVPVILVPQPSDDPNDPLVNPLLVIGKPSLTII